MKQETIKSTFANEQEYFLSEEKSEQKHELLSGKLITMTGVSFEHNEQSGYTVSPGL